MLVSRPPDVSAHGFLIDNILDGSLIVLAAVFLMALSILVLALLKRRKGGETLAGDTPVAIRGTLALAALFFLCIDLPLAVRSLRDLSATHWNLAQAEADPRALRVEVEARQWTWEGRLPGHDGVFATADDVVTVGEIRVPAGRPVLLQMASADVVHAFHAPSLRIQQDIIPGHLARTWFLAAGSGRFEVACTQFCGASHAQMVAPLIILAPRDFNAWLADASDRASREGQALRPRPDWGWPWMMEGARTP